MRVETVGGQRMSRSFFLGGMGCGVQDASNWGTLFLFGGDDSFYSQVRHPDSLSSLGKKKDSIFLAHCDKVIFFISRAAMSASAME